MSRQRIQHDPADPRHGTVNGYANLSCRCDLCRSAWAAYIFDLKDEASAAHARRSQARESQQLRQPRLSVPSVHQGVVGRHERTGAPSTPRPAEGGCVIVWMSIRRKTLPYHSINGEYTTCGRFIGDVKDPKFGVVLDFNEAVRVGDDLCRTCAEEER